MSSVKMGAPSQLSTRAHPSCQRPRRPFSCSLQGECPLCPDGTLSFQDVASSDPDIGPLEALFRNEERYTTRYLLTGRR